MVYKQARHKGGPFAHKLWCTSKWGRERERDYTPTSAVDDSDSCGVCFADKSIGGVAGVISALSCLNATNLQYRLHKHEVVLSQQFIVHSVLCACARRKKWRKQHTKSLLPELKHLHKQHTKNTEILSSNSIVTLLGQKFMSTIMCCYSTCN